MLLKQKIAAHAKIGDWVKSRPIHQPPQEWQWTKNAVQPIDPRSIPAIQASGWSPEMDALSREPRRGRHYNTCREMLSKVRSHNSAWPFKDPVDKDLVPNYYSIIASPMDLSTMDTRLESGFYTSPKLFIDDLKLIFSNCKQFNDASTIYAKTAVKLEKYMWALVQEIPEWFAFREK